MSSLRKTFKTDKNAEIKGVKVPIGINEHNNREMSITLTRMTRTNKKYAQALDEATRPHQAAIQAETINDDFALKMLQGVFADTILLGWDNIPKSELTGNDDDTDELLFTRENVMALFEEMPDLYQDWKGRAEKAATFREVMQKGAAGN